MTTGKWAVTGVPHTGWRCIDIKDLGDRDPRVVCEMCEVHSIRYVHEMHHDDYRETLYCGCVCAGHMEEDPDSARQREHLFRKQQTRRKNWLSRRWRPDWPLGEYVKTDGFRIIAWKNAVGDGYCARVEHRDTGYQRQSKLFYPTLDAAKLAAFDATIDMAARLKRPH